MWMTNELLPEIWGFFLANLDDIHQPQNWQGHMRLFWKIAPFSWSKQLVHSFFPKPFNQVMQNRHLVLKGEKPPTQIGHHMQRIFAPKIAS